MCGRDELMDVGSTSASQNMGPSGWCPLGGATTTQDQARWLPHQVTTILSAVPKFASLSLNAQLKNSIPHAGNPAFFSLFFLSSPLHVFPRIPKEYSFVPQLHPGCRMVPQPAAWPQTPVPPPPQSPAFPNQSLQLGLCGARLLLP